ncbi:MAG: penicillin-binding protein activator LpoB, partial [Planctomycetota bacterium]|nr:penicillin-binding protein activator LpoB [Planctomycetota bacterium]
GGKTVTRTDSQAAKDLSGRWNDVDAKQVANELIPKAVNAGWIDRFIAKHNREPRIQLGKVIVRADGEVISTDVFMKEIRGEFINSGKVVVLDEDKTQTREELADQAAFAARAKEMAQEEAADFLLKGSIATQNDQEGRQAVKYYLVTLEITDVQARRIVWQGNTRIRKEVEQSRWK